MIKISDCIIQQHDLVLVVVAAVICLVGCFAALSLLSRARRSDGRIHLTWLLAAGMVGGASLLASTFGALLAFRPSVPPAYHAIPTMLSVLVAILLACLAFGIA